MSPAVRKEFLIQCAEDRQEVGGFWGNLSSHGRGLPVRFCSLFCLEMRLAHPISQEQPRMSRQMNPQYTYRSPCGVRPHHPNVEVYHVHAKRKSNSPLLFSTGQDRILGTYAMGGSAPEATRWFLDSLVALCYQILKSKSLRQKNSHEFKVCSTGEISPYLKEWLSGYRDGSAAKSPCYSCTGPRFDS